MNTAHNIKRLRTKKGWSQRELATRSGLVHPAAIGHYERGRRTPGLANLERLAKALKVSVTELLK
jgi:transcriptional regulator with XRE-family HTH domain